ncbi:MAG TPA: protein tyrosine phosphatase family protein [Gemmatimonadales bacterium]|jgi:protein tyrosine phosphatase (PTP) superfamily phosphohydrolase (DUF442 family)|nr:protein tyrosine phosphatase family protein [Gemmatimonadales bacterium]
MSELLAALAGLPNACEPVPGLVTGGQPTPAHIAALRAAGCEAVVDLRDPMEPRPLDEPAAVRSAGMEYVNIPVSGGTMTDATLARMRDTVSNLVGDRRVFVHCGSGNRVGAVLIPYLMLDRGLGEEEAVEIAMTVGMRSAELMEWALAYVKARKGKG